MSRIEAVEAVHLRRPPEQPGGRQEEIFLLRLVTEDGTEGWGEAHGSPHVLRACVEAPVTHASAQGLAQILRGADPADIPGLRARMEAGTAWIGRDGAPRQAIAAAELALWDLAGKRAGQPVWRLLGAAPRPLPCYASGKVLPTASGTADRITAERTAGFTAHKIGWPPFGADLAADLAFLEAARDAAGPEAPLMVDAAQAWDLPAATARAAAFARFGLAWIEEPLDREALDDQAALRASSPVPIASGEGECTARGLRALVARGCIDVLQPDVTRTGLLPALDAARAAHAAGLRSCSHSFTTALNVAAHAQWLLAAPGGWMLEWPVQPLRLWAALFPGAPVPVGGMLAPSEAPGWGVTPDPAAIARWRTDGVSRP